MGIEMIPWSRDGEAVGDGGGESGSGSPHGIEMMPMASDGSDPRGGGVGGGEGGASGIGRCISVAGDLV